MQLVLIAGRARAQDGTVTEQKAKAATYGEGNRTPHRTEFLTEVETVRIELKNAGTTPVSIPATDAVAVDPAHHKVEFENDRVRVVRMTYPVGYKNPPHTHLRGVN